MTKILEGKVVLITGGTRGIGLATAREFISGGAVTLITGTGTNTVGPAARLLGIDEGAAYVLDGVSDCVCRQIVEDIVRRHGRIDVLVNNAGIASQESIDEITVEGLDHMFGVNFHVPFLLSRAFANLADESAGGSIVNVTSIAAFTGGLAANPAYAASKAALVCLTKSLARQFANRKIRVNSVAPADIETDMTLGWPRAMKQQLVEATPLKRFGHSDEVANAVVFLASEHASYITGQTLSVNGGIYMS